MLSVWSVNVLLIINQWKENLFKILNFHLTPIPNQGDLSSELGKYKSSGLIYKNLPRNIKGSLLLVWGLCWPNEGDEVFGFGGWKLLHTPSKSQSRTTATCLPCWIILYIQIVGGLPWLTFNLLFYVLIKMLILPCSYWLYIQLFTSNNEITEMYTCQILEVYSIPMLCEWAESSSLVFFFFLVRSETTVPATYMSFLVILIDLFGFQKDTVIMCMNQSQWILLEYCMLHSTSFEDNEMYHCLHHL